jgi:hypothetical protein
VRAVVGNTVDNTLSTPRDVAHQVVDQTKIEADNWLGNMWDNIKNAFYSFLHWLGNMLNNDWLKSAGGLEVDTHLPGGELAKDITLASAVILSEDIIVPKGTTLKKGTVLKTDLKVAGKTLKAGTLTEDVLLQSGVVLNKGTVLAQDSVLPAGTAFPRGLDLPSRTYIAAGTITLFTKTNTGLVQGTNTDPKIIQAGVQSNSITLHGGDTIHQGTVPSDDIKIGDKTYKKGEAFASDVVIPSGQTVTIPAFSTFPQQALPSGAVVAPPTTAQWAMNHPRGTAGLAAAGTAAALGTYKFVESIAYIRVIPRLLIDLPVSTIARFRGYEGWGEFSWKRLDFVQREKRVTTNTEHKADNGDGSTSTVKEETRVKGEDDGWQDIGFWDNRAKTEHETRVRAKAQAKAKAKAATPDDIVDAINQARKDANARAKDIIDAMDKNFGKTVAELTGMRGDIGKLSTGTADLKTAVTNLKTAVDGNTAATGTNTAATAKLNTAVGQLDTAVQNAASKTAALTTKLDESITATNNLKQATLDNIISQKALETVTRESKEATDKARIAQEELKRVQEALKTSTEAQTEQQRKLTEATDKARIAQENATQKMEELRQATETAATDAKALKTAQGEATRITSELKTAQDANTAALRDVATVAEGLRTDVQGNTAAQKALETVIDRNNTLLTESATTIQQRVQQITQNTDKPADPDAGAVGAGKKPSGGPGGGSDAQVPVQVQADAPPALTPEQRGRLYKILADTDPDLATNLDPSSANEPTLAKEPGYSTIYARARAMVLSDPAWNGQNGFGSDGKLSIKGAFQRIAIDPTRTDIVPPEAAPVGDPAPVVPKVNPDVTPTVPRVQGATDLPQVDPAHPLPKRVLPGEHDFEPPKDGETPLPGARPEFKPEVPHDAPPPVDIVPEAMANSPLPGGIAMVTNVSYAWTNAPTIPTGPLKTPKAVTNPSTDTDKKNSLSNSTTIV